MITNADFVSRIISGARLLTKDEHISKRYVLSIGRNKVTTYISQKLQDRTLHKESQLFRTIDCVELTRINSFKCPILSLRNCKDLYRTNLPIEGLIYSRYGSSILRVTNMDNTVEITPSTITASTNASKRQYANLDLKYYIQDGYIYTPFEIGLINIVILSLNEKESVELSSCTKCDECRSVWDYMFICPDKLLEAIIQEVIQEVNQIYKRSIVDENPDLDSNSKQGTK